MVMSCGLLALLQYRSKAGAHLPLKMDETGGRFPDGDAYREFSWADIGVFYASTDKINSRFGSTELHYLAAFSGQNHDLLVHSEQSVEPDYVNAWRETYGAPEIAVAAEKVREALGALKTKHAKKRRTATIYSIATLIAGLVLFLALKSL